MKRFVLLTGLSGLAVFAVFFFAPSRPVHPDAAAIRSASATEPAPQWARAVERARGIVRAAMAEQSVPGLSMAVGAGGDVVWAEGFGWADLKAGVPVTPDTRFRIGTASTVLTSAAAGLLVDQGRLRLDEEIQTYVPKFPKKPWPVTLRQLMADVSGVGMDGGSDGPLNGQRCAGPVDALPYFAGEPLQFEPGTQFRRSNYGWILVSAAVEAAASQPFTAFLRQQIFAPLGMKNTGAESAAEENPERVGEPAEDPPPATLVRHLILEPLGIAERQNKTPQDPATIYFPGWGNDPLFRYRLHVMRPHNLSCYAGSMAFLSTASDLARFGVAMHGGKLLQPATVRLLQSPQQLRSGAKTGSGLGWDIGGGEAAGRDGELRGERLVSFRMFPQSGIVVAVMANCPRAETAALVRQVAEAFTEPARP